MSQFNVHEAKSNLSQLLDMVERGEEVIIARHGKAIAQLVPLKRSGLVLGAALEDSNINRQALERDDWWKPMTDAEVEAWLHGRP